MATRKAPRTLDRSRYAILGALTIQPMSGYDLRRFVEENLGFFWSESYGQIYPMLHRLEAEGCIAQEPGQSSRRVPYRITTAGRARLTAWLQQPAAVEVPRVEILLKLFFAGQAPDGTAQRHLRAFRVMHTERLARYDAVAARLDGPLAQEPDARFWRATLAYGRQFSRAMLAWCAEAEEIVTAPAPVPTRRPPRRGTSATRTRESGATATRSGRQRGKR